MIFKNLHLKEGLFERTISFDKDVNLVYSQKNSCGKTTLIRFLLYALGYNIPNTRKIKFGNCEVELEIEVEEVGSLYLARYNNFSIEVKKEEQTVTYVLPEQQNELHSIIFGTSNQDILENLLGAYYVDQEKGWTLLNRGVVIGSIHFNIEELIRGLAGCDCTKLISKEAQLTKNISKYRQMFSVAQYRETLETASGSLANENYGDEVDIKLNQLSLEKNRIKAELKRIDSTLSGNRQFKKFVADMKLLIETPDGTTVQVTEDNIVGLNDAIELLMAKRKIVSKELAEVLAKIEVVNSEKEKEYEQLEFYKTATQLEIFDKKISRMPMNPIAIKQEIVRLEKERKSVREEISKVTKNNNTIVSKLSNNLIKYLTELGLGDKDSISSGYLFTSNLKELSGALLHKTVFAFRLAYILSIEDVINRKMPIILDSPSGKEVDQENINLMMDILKRDFSDHQIIIASIFKYEFENLKTIEIKGRLISENWI